MADLEITQGKFSCKLQQRTHIHLDALNFFGRPGNYTVPLQKIFHFGMHVVFVGRDRRKFVYSHGLPPFRLTSMIQGVRVGVSTDQR